MGTRTIEQKSRQLIKRIWDRRSDPTLFPNGVLDRLEILDPKIAATILGAEFVVEESLTNWGEGEGKFEIAGLVDRQAGKIAVSRRFDPTVMRFTGAHEVGHWILHPKLVMRRDRPLNGLPKDGWKRPPLEAEADYFAACFLMPRNLVREVVENTFQMDTPIRFDEGMAQWFSPDDPYRLIYPDEGGMDRELAIARAESYMGRHFHSIASTFRVSTQTMAIRLNELGLVRS